MRVSMVHMIEAHRRMERSHGTAFVRLGPHGRLADLRQQGSAKAILPRVEGRPEIVFLNTSGGLTGGDTLSLGVSLGEGARATATTQTAERAYHAGGGVARVSVAHDVGRGAWLDWLPQETILYDGSAVERTTRIALAEDAGCLITETVILGRHAMGETVRQLHLRDRREVLREGRPVLLDPFRLDGDALSAGNVVLGGARAFAVLAMVARGAEDAVGRARAALDMDGVQSAASGFDGKLVVRMVADEGWPLRRQVAKVLTALRGTALPRVWQI